MEKDYDDDFSFVSRPYVPPNFVVNPEDLIVPCDINLKPKRKTSTCNKFPLTQYIQEQQKIGNNSYSDSSPCQYFDFIKICFFATFFKNKYSLVPYQSKYLNDAFLQNLMLKCNPHYKAFLALLQITNPFQNQEST